MEVARTGETAHPGIQAVWLANIINRQSGGVIVAPWDLDQLSEEWIELFKSLVTELPEMKSALEKVAAYREKFRRNHPTYGRRYQ